MRWHIINIVCALLFVTFPLSSHKIKDRVIWEGQPYAAFTSLAYYNGYFYCTFREANQHWDNTGKDCGVIRLLRSRNSRTWKLCHTYRLEGHDLRDPQLCITPDKRLMLSVEDVVYIDKEAKYRKTLVSFINNRNNITDFEEMKLEPPLPWNWLWQPELVNGKICGFIYCPFFAFASSVDGIHFNIGDKISGLGSPTEASVTYYNNKYYAIVRTDGNAMLGNSTDTLDWQWSELNEQLASPKLFVYNNRLLCAGRSFDKQSRTTLFEIFPDSQKVEKIVHLSQPGDSAYPGVVVHQDKIYVSYYLSNRKRSNIHFAKLDI